MLVASDTNVKGFTWNCTEPYCRIGAVKSETAIEIPASQFPNISGIILWKGQDNRKSDNALLKFLLFSSVAKLKKFCSIDTKKEYIF